VEQREGTEILAFLGEGDNLQKKILHLFFFPSAPSFQTVHALPPLHLPAQISPDFMCVAVLTFTPMFWLMPSFPSRAPCTVVLVIPAGFLAASPKQYELCL